VSRRWKTLPRATTAVLAIALASFGLPACGDTTGDCDATGTGARTVTVAAAANFTTGKGPGGKSRSRSGSGKSTNRHHGAIHHYDHDDCEDDD
jgi:hypothetical protein